MNNKKKNILLGILVVGVISMTVAFAALSTNLNISGTANVASTNWNIHFQNWEKVTLSTGTNGNTNTAESPAVNQLTMTDTSNVTKVQGIAVTLNQPGDIARYNFEIKNSGNITARLSNFEANLSPSSEVVGYQVKCYSDSSRTGTEVDYNSTLAPNGVAYCYIEIKYNDASNGTQTAGSNQVYTQSAVSTSLSASWTWIQDDGSLVTGPVWDKYYTPTQTSGGSTLPANERYWIQENTSTGTKEVCGTLNGTTVCLDPSRWDCGETIIDEEPSSANNYRRVAHCSNSTGYIVTKKAEIEAIQGVTCGLVFSEMSNEFYELRCMSGNDECMMGNNGRAECSNAAMGLCKVNTDGTINCF